MKLNVHKVKNVEDVLPRYRIIPYGELVEVLKNDGLAFLEDDPEQRLKRQTVWRACRKLSEMVGKQVRYKSAIINLKGNPIEGYLLSLSP